MSGYTHSLCRTLAPLSSTRWYQRVELRGANVLHNEWVYPDMSYEEAAIPVLASSWHANLITHGFASAPVVVNDAQYLAVLDEYQRLAEQNGMYIIFAYY